MKNDFFIKSKGSVSMSVKWVAGILLSGIITIGAAAFIMHYKGIVERNDLSDFQYGIFFFVVPLAACSSFVFLSCLFVTSNKMYAGILVTLLSLLFITYGAYEHYNYDGHVDSRHITIYTGFIIGLITGLFLSYRNFKNNKWKS